MTDEEMRAEFAAIRARVDGLPVIGQAIETLHRDVRLLRAAINDMARVNVTAGEIEAMHTDIDRRRRRMAESVRVMNAYDQDFFAWTQAQADALRRRATDELDWINLEDEIRSLGNRERREIRKLLARLLAWLLQWRYQPDHQCPRWRASIREARSRIALTIKDSPSLASFPGEALADAYRSALNDRDINYLDSRDVPTACPWSAEQVLDIEFWPS